MATSAKSNLRPCLHLNTDSHQFKIRYWLKIRIGRLNKAISNLHFFLTSTNTNKIGAGEAGKVTRKHARASSGKGFRFYCRSCKEMPECKDGSIALTVTSPPYWNAIDYDLHAQQNEASGESAQAPAQVWYRARAYSSFGKTLEEYLTNIASVFGEVLRVTKDGGFCAVVVGTILHNKGKHYPAPMLITERMLRLGWEFHQDIIWNKVTGGVKRAGCFIQHPRAGYYYPNIMTEYILIFRKSGELWRESKEEALAIDDVFKRDIANNIWHIAPVPPRTIDHPCPYPDELVRRLILLYSRIGDEVLDPFLGSGQTALVASRYGRLSVGYDIERRYIALSKRRFLSPPPQRKHNLLPFVDKVAASVRDYIQEREVFDRLKSGCSNEARKDYESAINNLLNSYNTASYENRFIVGGAVEIFTYALLSSVGINCQMCSAQGKARDILLQGGKRLSIKGTFTGGASSIKLINQLGDGQRKWNIATLFVVSEVGIVFGAPDMVSKDHINYPDDGLQLKKSGLQILINNTDNVLAMDIAKKPATETLVKGNQVSKTIAFGILRELKSEILLKAFNEK